MFKVKFRWDGKKHTPTFINCQKFPCTNDFHILGCIQVYNLISFIDKEEWMNNKEWMNNEGWMNN